MTETNRTTELGEEILDLIESKNGALSLGDVIHALCFVVLGVADCANAELGVDKEDVIEHVQFHLNEALEASVGEVEIPSIEEYKEVIANAAKLGTSALRDGDTELAQETFSMSVNCVKEFIENYGDETVAVVFDELKAEALSRVA